MASPNEGMDNLCCVCWRETDTGQRFFVNFSSNAPEDCIIKMPPQLLGPRRYLRNDVMGKIAMENGRLEAAIKRCLTARYGSEMPEIYVTEDGEDFVMDMYVCRDHFQALVNMPKDRDLMPFFVDTTLATVQRRVLEVLDEPDLTIKSGKFSRESLELNISQPTGRRANKDELRALLLGPPPANEEPLQQQLRRLPNGSVRPGQHLLCTTTEDRDKRRSVHYNIVASDEPESIRLPDLMLKMSQMCRAEATSFHESMRMGQIDDQVGNKMAEILKKLYHNKQPPVYLAEENNNDLVINVPIHVEHAPLLRRCLLGEENRVRIRFLGSITKFHREYFFAASGRRDKKSNTYMYSKDDRIDPVKPGRPATEQEIHSLFTVHVNKVSRELIFVSHENYEDLREGLDSLMEIASKRGIATPYCL